MNKNIFSPEIQKFIKDHEHHDPFALMLKHKEIFGVPIKEVVQQIQSRQKAKKKLPDWYSNEGVFFPHPISLEQCSSQEAALYKSSLFSGKRMIDLTGGMGVDTYCFSKRFNEVVYVEKDSGLSEIAKHNFRVLKSQNIQVVNLEAEEYIKTTDAADLIYIDPSRRTQRKIFLMKDSEPDVSALLPQMLRKSTHILIKLSPLMDISSAVDELTNVFRIHIVAVANEVKEVLLHIRRGYHSEPLRTAVQLKNNDIMLFEFNKSEELLASITYSPPQKYLYEPSAAILKAGAFKLISKRYSVDKLHQNSHLYTSNHLVPDFPGKTFNIMEVFSFDSKRLINHVSDGKANIVVRNFPISVDKIRFQTKIKEGGDDFLFFTTDIDERKVVIKAVKVAFE